MSLKKAIAFYKNWLLGSGSILTRQLCVKGNFTEKFYKICNSDSRGWVYDDGRSEDRVFLYLRC